VIIKELKVLCFHDLLQVFILLGLAVNVVIHLVTSLGVKGATGWTHFCTGRRRGYVMIAKMSRQFWGTDSNNLCQIAGSSPHLAGLPGLAGWGNSGGIAPGNHTLAITASSGSLSHSATITVVVKWRSSAI